MRPGRKARVQTAAAQRGRKRDAARKLVGVCVNSRAHIAEPGRVLCAACRRKNRAANAAWVKVHRINGQCRECPAMLAAGDITRCAGCRERRKLRPSRKRAYRMRNERGYASRGTARRSRGEQAA
jgi:hypothetical protein